MVAFPDSSVAGAVMGQITGPSEVAVHDVVAVAVEESFAAAAAAAALSRLRLLEESWPS